MKIVVSYLSSKFDITKTIDMINNTDADGIHVDLTDGIYAGINNFDISSLPNYFKNNSLPLDVHLMTYEPSKYLDTLKMMNVDCIYMHPSTQNGIIHLLSDLKKYKIKPGIAINIDEDIESFEHLYPYVERVLLMSVPIGYGGNPFNESTSKRLQKLKYYQKENNFSIFVDGGINPETIKKVMDADGVVSGSYICQSDDFNQSIKNLKDSSSK